MVSPVASARFLGVFLDRKLSWKSHCEAVEKKLKTQDFALARIAGKTWGPSLAKAREVYTKCIRSAIAYGASSYHTPTPPGGQPTGPAKRLAKAQNRSLRIVAGAYKATPIRHLEIETWVPPLDLYLNKRLADFEARIGTPRALPWAPAGAPEVRTGSIIQEACSKLARRGQRNRARARGRRPPAGPPAPTATERATITVERWATGRVGLALEEALGLGDRGPEEALTEEWKRRWEAAAAARERDRGPGAPQRLADRDPNFSDQVLQRYEGLNKAQSSLLVQARTGAIGLKDFLFTVGVPEVVTPHCTCGIGRETVEHLVVWCLNPPIQRYWEPNILSSSRDLQWALQGFNPRARRLAGRVLAWLMDSGRLLEYSLARRLAQEKDLEELEQGLDPRDGWA